MPTAVLVLLPVTLPSMRMDAPLLAVIDVPS